MKILQCALYALLTGLPLCSSNTYPECVWVGHKFAAHIQPFGWRGDIKSLWECMGLCYREYCDIFKYNTQTHDCWVAKLNAQDNRNYFVPGSSEEVCGDRQCVQSVGGDASRAHMENEFERMSQMMTSMMNRNAQGDMQDNWMDEFFSSFFAGADPSYDSGNKASQTNGETKTHENTQVKDNTGEKSDTYSHTKEVKSDTYPHSKRKSRMITKENAKLQTNTHTKSPNVLQYMSDEKRKPHSNTHTQSTNIKTEDEGRDFNSNDFEWNAMKCTKLCSEDGTQCSMQCQ